MDTNLKQLKNLEIGEPLTVNGLDFHRVPGGWVVVKKIETPGSLKVEAAMTFVPESQEFDFLSGKIEPLQPLNLLQPFPDNQPVLPFSVIVNHRSYNLKELLFSNYEPPDGLQSRLELLFNNKNQEVFCGEEADALWNIIKKASPFHIGEDLSGIEEG